MEFFFKVGHKGLFCFPRDIPSEQKYWFHEIVKSLKKNGFTFRDIKKIVII